MDKNGSRKVSNGGLAQMIYVDVITSWRWGLFFLSLFVYVFIYGDRESPCTSQGGAEREGREGEGSQCRAQCGTRSHEVSDHEPEPKSRVGHLTT